MWSRWGKWDKELVGRWEDKWDMESAGRWDMEWVMELVMESVTELARDHPHDLLLELKRVEEWLSILRSMHMIRHLPSNLEKLIFEFNSMISSIFGPRLTLFSSRYLPLYMGPMGTSEALHIPPFIIASLEGSNCGFNIRFLT